MRPADLMCNSFEEEPMTNKEIIVEVLQHAELSISMTRRRGSNGLRNAGEIADKIIEALKVGEVKDEAD